MRGAERVCGYYDDLGGAVAVDFPGNVEGPVAVFGDGTLS